MKLVTFRCLFCLDIYLLLPPTVHSTCLVWLTSTPGLHRGTAGRYFTGWGDTRSTKKPSDVSVLPQAEIHHEKLSFTRAAYHPWTPTITCSRMLFATSFSSLGGLDQSSPVRRSFPATTHRASATALRIYLPLARPSCMKANEMCQSAYLWKRM